MKQLIIPEVIAKPPRQPREHRYQKTVGGFYLRLLGVELHVTVRSLAAARIARIKAQAKQEVKTPSPSCP